MPHELILETVDIFKRPVLDMTHQAQAGTQITIGDLHGNAMKLMFMLVKHGILENINDDQYNRLVEIYKTPILKLTKALLDEFNDILSTITFNNHSLVRLIGDELADRGNNDYFTLKILEKLHQHHVPVEILVSNHGIEFIEASEKQDNFHAPMLQSNHAQSMENLQILVEKSMVTRAEILEITNECYKPTLKAISYSFSEDQNEITIYSHAGIGLNTIQNLAKKLKVKYQDSNAIELAQTIDKINAKFQKHVQEKTLNRLYTREQIAAAYWGYTEANAPLVFLMWNRSYESIDRPDDYQGYKINFAHGHDDRDETKENIYNLDNHLGKMQNMNEGFYSVLYSQVGQIECVIAPEELEEIDGQEPVRNPAKPCINPLLEKIQTKAQELQNRGHSRAAECARNLYASISEQYKQLNNKEIDVQAFQTNCNAAITIARPELEKHRGWKQILGNLALAILGLGVFYVIGGCINKAVTGNFLFFKTDSAHQIDQLEQSIQSIKATH